MLLWIDNQLGRTTILLWVNSGDGNETLAIELVPMTMSRYASMLGSGNARMIRARCHGHFGQIILLSFSSLFLNKNFVTKSTAN